MKCLWALFIIVLISCKDNAQETTSDQKPKLRIRDSALKVKEKINPYSPVDISPMDMVYLPEDYPVLKMSKKISELPVARVVYSRPHMQDRVIFGGLLKYGEPWRLGANEATEIEFFQAVSIQNKTVSKGRYVLYCIPNEQQWTIILNSNLFTWGLTPDPSKDLYKFPIPVSKTLSTVEYFTIAFENKNDSADLIMAWENFEGRLPIQY